VTVEATGLLQRKVPSKGDYPFYTRAKFKDFPDQHFADAKAKRPGAHPVLGAGFGEMDPSIGANLRHAKVNHP
jgi:hypothetical protein